MSSPLQNNITNLQNLLDKVNALPEEVTLPELTNEGVADDLVSGKELIDSSGNVITGTNPYEKAATDTEVATQTELLTQAVAALDGKVGGGSGGSGSGNVETCTVMITNVATIYYIGLDNNGNMINCTINPNDGSTQSVNIVKGTIFVVNSKYTIIRIERSSGIEDLNQWSTASVHFLKLDAGTEESVTIVGD
jgi:hypothetical protein